MSIKPTSVHKNTLIYYIIIVVNFLHVSAIFCGHLQGGIFSKYILQKQPYQCKNMDKIICDKFTWLRSIHVLCVLHRHVVSADGHKMASERCGRL